MSYDDRLVVFLSVCRVGVGLARGWVGEGVDFGAKRVKYNLARDDESKNVVNKRERDRECVCVRVCDSMTE